MAAGDVTKELIGNIRTLLDDQAYLKIKNDGIILHGLNKAQYDLMTQYYTSKRKYEVALVVGTTEYLLDPHIIQVQNCNLQGCTFELTVYNSESASANYNLFKLTVQSNIVFEAGDTVDITTFIKPLQRDVQTDDEDPPTTYDNDLITKTNDPIIEPDFLRCLEYHFTSRYRKYNEELPTMAEVIADVKNIRNRLYQMDRVNADKKYLYRHPQLKF